MIEHANIKLRKQLTQGAYDNIKPSNEINCPEGNSFAAPTYPKVISMRPLTKSA